MKKCRREPVILYLLVIAIGLGSVYALLAAGAELFTDTVSYTVAAIFSGEYETAPDGTLRRSR